MIDLPIIHLELEPHEIGQDRRGARLRFYRRYLFAGGDALDVEPVIDPV
jgi:hypothetical protein